MVVSVLCCTLSFLLMQSQNTLSFNFIDLPSRYTNRRKGARVIKMKHHWNTCIFGRGGYTDCAEGLGGRSYISYDRNNMEGEWDVWEVLLGDLIYIAFYLFEAFLVVLSHSCFRTSIPSNSPSPDSGEKQRSSITTYTKGRGKARPG